MAYIWEEGRFENRPFRSWEEIYAAASNSTMPTRLNPASGEGSQGDESVAIMQSGPESVISSPSNTSVSPASHPKQASSEPTPSHTAAKAWHMTTHMTGEGEEQSWISANFDGGYRDKVTLIVTVNETNDKLSIMPCFPAGSQIESAQWNDPKIRKPALAKIKAYLTDLDPSVCLGVKTKALKTHKDGGQGDWHVRALETLEAEQPGDVVATFLGTLRTNFGQLAEGATIEPGVYYDNRSAIIKPPARRRFLQTPQAKKLFSQLPHDHRCYRPSSPTAENPTDTTRGTRSQGTTGGDQGLLTATVS